MIQALQERLCGRLELGTTDTGLHLPVMFRERCNDHAIARAGLEYGLELRGLSYFYNEPEDRSRSMRACGLLLGFAAIPPAEIRRGVDSLCKLLDEHSGKRQQGHPGSRNRSTTCA